MVIGIDVGRKETADISIPVRHTARGEVQPGWDGPLQHVPRGINIARPEDGPVALRSKIGGARQDHHAAAVSKVAPEAVVNRSSMEQRIDIEVAPA